MQVSRELDYGVRAVVVMARNADEVMSKRRIAEAFSIPVNFLAIILPKLVRTGIVESLPGPRGGYRLARSPERISIYDIVLAINRGFSLNRCEDVRRRCTMKSRCPVAPHWEQLQRDVEAYLKGVTFDRLAEETTSSR